MAIKSKYKKFWNLKAFILAFQIAFIFCFFIGIFWNHPVRVEVFNENSWYYINRGYPISWAGVSKPFLSVDPPIIKAPFLTSEIYGDTYDKIIDLSIFLPLFLGVLLVAYPITFVFSKAAEENKSFNIILVPSFILLALGCIFFYFFWFPRI